MMKTTMSSVICITWRTEVMPVPAYDYFHVECLVGRVFKSEAIANGKRREIKVEAMGNNAICSECYRKLGPCQSNP